MHYSFPKRMLPAMLETRYFLHPIASSVIQSLLAHHLEYRDLDKPDPKAMIVIVFARFSLCSTKLVDQLAILGFQSCLDISA